MPNEFEKEFDDEVYEDDFYEESFDDEEMIEDEMLDEEELIEDDVEEDEKHIAVILACDDCDYRWEDVIVKRKDEDIEDLEIICPMCGSTNVSQI